MLKRIIIAFLVLLGLLTLGITYLFSSHGEYYKTYSPDGQYSVHAKKYNWQGFVPINPGGSGDASGKVILYDEIAHKVLYRAPIPILRMAQDIQWEEDTAYFIGESYPNILNPWKLPRPISHGIRND